MHAAGPEEAWWSLSCTACSPSGPPFLHHQQVWHRTLPLGASCPVHCLASCCCFGQSATIHALTLAWQVRAVTSGEAGCGFHPLWRQAALCKQTATEDAWGLEISPNAKNVFRFVRRMDGKWEPRQGEVSQWLFRAGDRPFKPSKLQKCRDLKRLLPGDSLYSTLAFGWWLQLLASQAVDSKRNRRVSPLLSSEGVSSPWRTKQQGF